jgi:hypothetical protein
MSVIDVDSHVTVTKRVEDSAFEIQLLPGGSHLMEFDGHRYPDSPWPESVKGMKAALAGCSETDVLKVLGGNAAELLHL